MAIQQIGGQGVYVITGSGRDPRKTSAGQSWANLVTQQKYMLIKEAQKEALRQIEFEQLSFEDRRKAQEQLRQQLLDQIAAEKKGIADLRVKQIDTNEARTLANQRQRGRRSGDGSVSITIPSESKVQQYYTSEQRAAQNQKMNARAKKQALIAAKDREETYLSAAPQLMSVTELENYGSYDNAIEQLAKEEEAATERYNEVTAAKNTFTGASAPAKRKIQRQMQTRTERFGTGGGGQDAEPLGEFKGFEPEIKGREKRIAELQDELDALGVLERPKFDTIERTRQIYGDKFMGPRRRLRGPQTTQTQPVEQPVGQPVGQSVTQPDLTGEQPSNLEEMQSFGVPSDPMIIGGANNQKSVQGKPVNQSVGTTDPMQIEGLLNERDRLQQPREPVDVFQGEPDLLPTLTRPNQQNMNRLREAEMTALDLPDFEFKPSQVENVSSSIDQDAGRQFLEDMTVMFAEQDKPESYKSQLQVVQFGTPQQKQMVAVKLLAQAANDFGPTSPQFAKAKKEILVELFKITDPSTARKQAKISRLMQDDPNDLSALVPAVRGITERDATTVSQLFSPSSDMSAQDVDELYKNAQSQLQSLPQARRTKALELLDLQYMAVMDKKIGIGI